MAAAASAAARRGVAYSVRGGLYLSLTNRCNAVPLLEARGPGFKMPPQTGFQPLDEGAPEPTADELAAVVDAAYSSEEARQIIGTGENDAGVVFAGLGEPLLRIGTLSEVVHTVRQRRHGVPWRINTNGLFGVEVAEQLAEFAVDSDGRHPFVVSVMLAAHTPPLYSKLMKPQDGKKFQDVCSFVLALTERGVTVEATAVDAPGVDVRALRQVALGLGATELRVRSFHPDPYDVLGLLPECTDEELEARTTQLKIEFHPDKHATSGEAQMTKASAQFVAVSDASAAVWAMREKQSAIKL
jgi:TatD family-associated radical SAM protein